MSTTTSRSTSALPTGPHPTDPGRRPRVRPFNTLFGLLFLAAAGAWAAHDQEVLDGDEIGRVVAVALIVLGVLGLVATLLVSRRGRPGRAGGPVDTTSDRVDAPTSPDESTDDDIGRPS